MRVIIAGSRSVRDDATVAAILDFMAANVLHIGVVLSGGAGGADRLGEKWAQERGRRIERYPADWRCYGKSAGIRRNVQMARHAERLIALWDGRSRGTRSMIDIARRCDLAVYVIDPERWAERAAIREYCGELPRPEAEWWALSECLQ